MDNFTQRLGAIEVQARALEDDVEAFVARASLAELSDAVEAMILARQQLRNTASILAAAERDFLQNPPSGVKWRRPLINQREE